MGHVIPKTLLLTGTPPGDSGVGALCLRDFVRQYPAGRIAIAVACPLGKDSAVAEFSYVPSLYVRWPYDSFHGMTGGPLNALRRHAAFRARALVRDRALSRRIIEFARAQHVELVCAVLDTPAMYRIAAPIAAAVGAELVAYVLDPPSGVCLSFGMDRLSRRTATRHFQQAMEHVTRCGVISERMGDEYRLEYGLTPIVLRHSTAEAPERRTPAASRLDPSIVRIGMAGSLYAEREWYTLLSALQSVNWQLAGRRVTLRVLGPTLPRIRLSCPATVEFLGWRDIDDTIAHLAECQFTYLPYWFDPTYQESVRLCFATKLTTYLTAGRPVFYHGPEDAAVMRFCQRFPVAYGCHSLDPAIVASHLEELAGNEALQGRLQAAGRSAVAEELNARVFRERCAELIGVASSDLQRRNAEGQTGIAV